MSPSLTQDVEATEQSPLLGSRSRDTPAETHLNGHSGDAVQPQSKEEQGNSSTKTLILVLGSTYVGSFLAALDSTIVATLSAPISNSFDSFTVLSWLASSYLIAQAACQPLTGKLTDIFGRKTGLIVCNAFFLVGNLICGLAKDEWMMIFGRVVAGMGGGGLNSIGTFIASDLVPLRQRGLIQGIGNLVWGIGSGIGGIYGGWMNDTIGWRYAFLLQAPLVAVSGILAASYVNIPLKKSDKSRLKRVDFLGAFLLVGTLVLLLLALNSGGNLVPWSHPLVIASFIASAVCGVAFVYVEDRVALEPMIPVRLLTNRTVGAACITNWLVVMAMYGLLFYGPIYFQVFGMSATQSGMRLIPQAVGVAVGSMTSGLIMRVTGKYYWLNVVMENIIVLAFLLVALTLAPGLPDFLPFIYFFMTGIGYSSMLTITLLALIAAVDHIHQAVITSASYAARSTGSSIGITIASAVFQNILSKQLWGRFGDLPGAADQIKRIRDNIDEVKHLPPGWQDGVIASYTQALRGVWWTVFGIMTLGMITSLFMREHKLHSNLARK